MHESSARARRETMAVVGGGGKGGAVVVVRSKRDVGHRWVEQCLKCRSGSVESQASSSRFTSVWIEPRVLCMATGRSLSRVCAVHMRARCA